MTSPDHIFNCVGFEWDKDNLAKNWEKHRVAFWESEELFFNQPLLLVENVKHSQKEERFYALGKTDAERYLFAVFTIRHKHIRVISVRDMSRKERKEYQNAEEKDSNL
jgi:uncharacterized DUF497 family protein